MYLFIDCYADLVINMDRFLKRLPPLNFSAEVVSLMANKPEPKQNDDSTEVPTAFLGRKISSLEGNRYAHYWSDL